MVNLKILSIEIILILINNVNMQKPEPTEKYPNVLTLVSPDLYFLHWKHDNVDITFEIHYKNTSKWMAFGVISPVNNYSDLVIGWVNDDGTGHFSDRNLDSQNSLKIDENQDWIIDDAFNKNEFKILKFTRKIKQYCNLNDQDDLDIQSGANSIIFGLGQDINNNDGIVLDFNSRTVWLNSSVVLLNTEPEYSFECQTRQLPVTFTSQPTGVYTSYIDLVDNGIYRFYWNFTKTDLIGEIHVKTNGWVSFGISPNGGMDKSDVIVGWINDNDGSVSFTDRYINKRQVIVDKKQDWKLLSYAQKDGYTIFKFIRPLVLCDSDDMNIQNGSPNMIFAYGLKDPDDGKDIEYHADRRGTKAINLISSSSPRTLDMKDIEIIEYSVSHVILPKVDTFYYGKTFKIPDLAEKRHIIKWELVLPKINIQNIHHFLLYECKPEYKGIPEILAGQSTKNRELFENCPIISFGWAVGGQLESWFPKDTGYPIGGGDGYSYIVPEIHYDNPHLKIGYIEKVIIRYYVTKNLQPNELAILTIGSHTSVFALDLPPQLEKIGINSFCPSECISQKMKTDEITIVAASPHTHLAGVEVWTKIIRNGEEKGYLFRNKYYDFNYQNTYSLDPPVKISKQDTLHTYCGYQTMNRTSFTRAGLSTRDEMCYQFLTYYPRKAKLIECTSLPFWSEVNNLLQSLNDTGDIKISNYNKSSYLDVIKTFYGDFLANNDQMSRNLAQKMINFYNQTKYMSICNGDVIEKAYDQEKIKKAFIEQNVCAESLISNGLCKSSQFSFGLVLLNIIFLLISK